MVGVTAVGAVHPRRVMTRNGARPGDELYVTGAIGAGAAGLEILRGQRTPELQTPDSGRLSGDPRQLAACIQRFRRPEPRVRFGVLLGRNRAARACIDLSDGLADGIRQMARASGVGVTIDAESVPIDPCARRWFEGRGQSAFDAAIQGGDDYELLFAVAPKSRSRLSGVRRLSGNLTVTRIGHLTTDPAIVVSRAGRLEALPPGFDHFGGS